MSKPGCELPDCLRPHYGRGWCKLHWRRWWRHGDAAWVPTQPRSPHERVMERVTRDADGCWRFHGSLDGHGYGQVQRSQPPGMLKAHRVVYEALVGPIPAGCHLHHRCGTRRCVNPAHLEPITPDDHIRHHNPVAARWARVHGGVT